MRHLVVIIGFVLVIGRAGRLEARERPIEELPQDIWELATVWTEPVKHVAKESRRFDPISGVWFGLLEGSVKSVERTAAFFLSPRESGPERSPDRPDGALLRYSF